MQAHIYGTQTLIVCKFRQLELRVCGHSQSHTTHGNQIAIFSFYRNNFVGAVNLQLVVLLIAIQADVDVF
jgi:hypothetical protein